MARDSTNPYTSALLRGFFVYLVMISGLLLLDDARVIHETTPIQPLEPVARGWRDTLVLTFREHGFQPAPTPLQ